MDNQSNKPIVLNKHHTLNIPPGSVYIGRGSKWGNPYVINKHGDRTKVVQKFREHLDRNPQLLADAKVELKGKNLICFCAPLMCHGDILLEVANEMENAHE